MRKILFVLLLMTGFISCQNFSKEAKPLYGNMKKLYGISATKCEIIQKVWSTAIFDHKYALDGTYMTDFNLALKKLHEEDEIKKYDNEIKYLRNELTTKVKLIKDTKEKSYDDFIDLYTDVMQLSELAINPQGNLQSFSGDIKKIDTDLNKKVIEFEARNPNFVE